jgi:type VI secretion system protein ImpK
MNSKTEPGSADATARYPAITPSDASAHATPTAGAIAAPPQRRGTTGTTPMAVPALSPFRTLRVRPLAPRVEAAPHPLMDAAYWLCADLLTLAAQIGLRGLQPAEANLRTHIDQLLVSLRESARSVGIRAEDAEEMQYAIVALLDELLVQTEWPGRAEWYRSPLQLVYFRENTAGENFFRRASALASQPVRAHVLLIYYYCLALGFRGRYQGPEIVHLLQVQDSIAAALDPYLEPSDPISPHGETADGSRSLLKREAPVVRTAFGIAIIAMVIFGLLRSSLTIQVNHAVERMHAFSTGRH